MLPKQILLNPFQSKDFPRAILINSVQAIDYSVFFKVSHTHFKNWLIFLTTAMIQFSLEAI
jgi:hypothetical protein